LWFAALALVDPSPEFKFGNTFDEHFYPWIVWNKETGIDSPLVTGDAVRVWYCTLLVQIMFLASESAQIGNYCYVVVIPHGQWRTQKLSEAWANISKTPFFQIKSLCKVIKYKASYVGKPGRLPGL
jgi:hypothetical protein